MVAEARTDWLGVGFGATSLVLVAATGWFVVGGGCGFCDVWWLSAYFAAVVLPNCAAWALLAFAAWRRLGRRAWWALLAAPLMAMFFIGGFGAAVRATQGFVATFGVGL